MDSFMDEKEQVSEDSFKIASVYANVCLTIISLSLVVISACFIIALSSGTSFDGRSVMKFAICDPDTKRCVKVNAGRRLETTN
tara:strand:+ start:186 stop:434 length:249 start_codon:yes stop_codon:yes gene_type:complete